MKTEEELNELKNEVEALNKKLAELSEDELCAVAGGMTPGNGVILITAPAERRSRGAGLVGCQRYC